VPVGWARPAESLLLLLLHAGPLQLVLGWAPLAPLLLLLLLLLLLPDGATQLEAVSANHDAACGNTTRARV
jgi:hypothetical protein